MAQDPYKYFRIEAAEIAAGLAQGLLDLEKHADAPLVARLLRLAHTLKGAARIVKHRELADLAHALEDVLAPLREAPVAQRLDAALALVDQMNGHVAAMSAPAPAPAAAAAPAPATAPAPAPAGELAPLPRFDTGAIDDALSALGRVHALVGRMQATADPRELAPQLEHVDRELRELREDIEGMRLSAAGTLFTSLERTARDAALAIGRRVAFAGDGGDVKVESQVLVALHGPLVQLVRNAVAHGIEPEAERRAAGKPAVGRVAIAVRSLGRRISITCEDDGRGLDLEAIRRAAQRRGHTGERGDAAELFQVLLRGGISTSREVSELAGRGVGLDVVREAADRLGGKVTAQTRAGQGTTVTIVVPVSLAAAAVVIVRAGDRVAAIPQRSVLRVGRVRAGEVVHGASGASLAYDDVVVPFAPLAGLLGARAELAHTAVFVDGGDHVVAIAVDRVIGIEQVVVHAPPAAPITAIVAGLALDARGEPYPVLEPRALAAAARAARAEPRTEVRRAAPILVVDDSLTTRMLEQSILESAGYAVELAASAEEGLAKLARTAYALVLADVEMPGMDGFGLVAEVRARPASAHLPVILVTSRDSPEDRRRGLAAGAQGYVVKGKFDQVELLAMIGRLVAR